MAEENNASYLDFGPKEPHHVWKKLPACEEFVGARRSKHTMVAWDDGLYIFGGDNGKRMLNDFLVFHIRDGSWARVVSTGYPPPPRYHHAAVVYKDSMFIFGGYTGDIYSNQNLQNKNDLFEFKFRSSQWIDWRENIEDPLPPARSAHGATVYNGKMYIFGGYDGHARLNDMWCIDFNCPSPQWSEVAYQGMSPPTCCNFPLSVVDDSMYMFSGQSGAKMTNSMYEFKFSKNRWIRIPMEHLLRGSTPPPQRRYGHIMVAYNRCLYIFGGVGDVKDDTDLHCYDLDTCSWSVVNPPEGSQVLSPRLFHSASVCGDYLYLFGGTVDSAGTRSGDMYQFCLAGFPKSTYVSDFIRLLHSQDFCDVKFLVGSGKSPVKAHCDVLAARSPFLRQRILDVYRKSSSSTPASSSTCSLSASSSSSSSPPPSLHAQEKHAPLPELFLPSEEIVIDLPEATEDIFQMALFFLYTDRLHPSLENASVEGMTVDQMLQMMELYKLSLMLEAKRMELLCVQYIQASINGENVLYVLRIASELCLASLKEYCLRSIVRESSYKHVIMSPAFESLDPNLMVEIVRRHETQSRPTSPDISQDRESSIPASLQDDMRRFLETDLGRPFANVVLQVQDDVVYAHSTLLASRSSYFEALFRSFMPADRKTVVKFGEHVPNLSAFQSLLRFIYYGRVQMPPEDALYIYSSPNFFGFSNNQLQDHCRYIIENDVGIDNVLPILEVADSIDLQVVKKHCLMIISDNFRLVNQQEPFRKLPRELLLDVLDILSIKLP